MKKIQHSIDIPASPDAVWEVLTDTDAYPDWNPFMTALAGTLHDGERLTVTIRPGDRTMTFRPTVAAAVPGRELTWVGRLGVRGLFDGRHEFLLEATPDGGTRLTQRETFTGVLVPAMPGVLADTATGFAAMNAALAARVATLHTDMAEVTA